jgi:Lactonase, 7-bladed beta-propeller
MRKLRVAKILIGLAAALCLAGCDHYVCSSGATFGNATCSSATTTTTTGTGTTVSGTVFVYFMNDTAGQMTAEAINFQNSQTFAQIPNWLPPPTVSERGYDGGLVIVNKAYLYMPYSDGNVYAYAINATTSELSTLTAVSLSLPCCQPSPIAADPAGNYIFVGDTSGIYVLSVNSTSGALTVTNSGQPFAASGLQPVYLTTDSQGKYLYVADGTNVLSYSYNSSTGALTSVGTLSGEPMRMLASEPSGGFIFGATKSDGANGSTLDDNIYVFAIGANGALSSPAAVSTPQTLSFIAVDPNLESGSELVYTFNYANSGGYEPIVELPFNPSTGAFGTAVASTSILSSIGKFDQSGNFLIAVGEDANSPDAGVLPLTVSGGALSNSLPNTGATSESFAVTDEPSN